MRTALPALPAATWAWKQVSGRGDVLSFGVFHQAYNAAWKDRVPYNVVLVQLDEGPPLFSNVLPLDRTDLSVGMRVSVTFDDEDGLALPRFVPEEDDGYR